MSKRLTCIKGLHPLTDDNVWIRPCDGRRYCRACQKATRRAYYLTLSETTGYPTEYSPQPRRNEYHWYNLDTQTRLTWAELFWDAT